MRKELTFTYEKSTKNTHRYQEQGTEHVVGILYVQRSAFSVDPEAQPPRTLTVTIETMPE